MSVWEEARRALSAVDITDKERILSFRLAIRERTLDPEWGRVLHETAKVRRAWSVQSFESAPVARLLTDGFVQTQGDTTVYFGPDANVLLSEQFLGQYCFSVVDGESGDVGLAFEPADVDAGRSQIEGVLWVDRTGRGL